MSQRFYREVALWSTLSHKNILKLTGVQADAERGRFVTVSEWMTHGNVMDYIRGNGTNRLELVRGSTFSFVHSLTCCNSCTERPRAWCTSTVSVSHTGTSKGWVFFPFRD